MKKTHIAAVCALVGALMLSPAAQAQTQPGQFSGSTGAVNVPPPPSLPVQAKRGSQCLQFAAMIAANFNDMRLNFHTTEPAQVEHNKWQIGFLTDLYIESGCSTAMVLDQITQGLQR